MFLGAYMIEQNTRAREGCQIFGGNGHSETVLCWMVSLKSGVDSRRRPW